MKYHRGAAWLRDNHPEMLKEIFEIARATSTLVRSDIEEFIDYQVTRIRGNANLPGDLGQMGAGLGLLLGAGYGAFSTFLNKTNYYPLMAMNFATGILVAVVGGGLLGEKVAYKLLANPDVEAKYSNAKADAESNLERKLN